MPKLTNIWAKIQGELLFDYLWLVSRTSRSRIEGLANLDSARQSGRPLLFTFWHQQSMLVAHFVHLHLDPRRYMPVLVGDARGQVLDRVGRRVGVQSTAQVDMGGNPMAAGRSVLHVVRAMKEGIGTVIAPDGPDGPPFVAKPGMAFLARKARAAVVPIGAFSGPVKQLNRWDRYLVTVPFSRMYFAIGKPIFTTPQDDEIALSERVSRAMDAVRNQAIAMAGAIWATGAYLE